MTHHTTRKAMHITTWGCPLLVLVVSLISHFFRHIQSETYKFLPPILRVEWSELNKFGKDSARLVYWNNDDRV